MPGLPQTAVKAIADRRERTMNLFGNSPAGAGPIHIPLDDVAPHPDNPPDRLTDVDDLASMGTIGQIQTCVVTTRATFLTAHPEHADAIGAARYVMVTGHRRLGAARKFGLEALSCDVRDDLVTYGTDYAVMVVENGQRKGLSPTAEARALRRLLDTPGEDGKQQSIRVLAPRLGYAPSHISKRLALLELPADMQQAVDAGTVSSHAAYTILSKLKDEEDRAAAYELVRSGTLVDRAVETVVQQREAARRTAAAQASLANEKIPEVDPRQFGEQADQHRLHDPGAVARAREEGTLVAAVDRDGGDTAYYTTAAAGETSDEQAQRDAAARGRESACVRLVASLPPAEELLEVLALHILEGGGSHSAAVKLASRWLTQVEPSTTNTDQAPEAPRRLPVVAFAVALAASELRARNSDRCWDQRDVAYVGNLRKVGYTPTQWETARLGAATA